MPKESYGAALHYFTGSKTHNIAIRRRGRQLGLKINEYGVFKGNKKVAVKQKSPFTNPWVGAVHSKYNLSHTKQTQRILKAMDHAHFTVLAHPSGRLLLQREPYDVDMTSIIRKARQRGCYIEINAQPKRLDLLDAYCEMAKDEGVLLCINSDAHSVMDFGNLRYGVDQTRRGWLESKDILNTRPLSELRRLIKKTM